MHNNQDGFNVIEGLLIILVLGFFGFAGWYIHNNKNAHPAQTANITSTKYSSTKRTSSKNIKNSQVTTVCTSSQLTLSLGQQNGAAGTFYNDLILTNNSNAPCILKGFPVVVLVDGNTQQQSQPASDSTDSSATSIILQPDATAHATANFPDPSVASGCSSTQSNYLYLTLPGGNTPLQVQDQATYCPGFDVGPFQSGI